MPTTMHARQPCRADSWPLFQPLADEGDGLHGERTLSARGKPAGAPAASDYSVTSVYVSSASGHSCILPTLVWHLGICGTSREKTQPGGQKKKMQQGGETVRTAVWGGQERNV